MGKQRFIGQGASSSTKKASAKKMAYSAQQVSQMALVLSQQSAEAHNNLAKMVDQRLALNEDAIIQLVNTNAILMREVARAIDFDWDQIGRCQFELNLIKDFTALLDYVSSAIGAKSPLAVFNEMAEMVQNTPAEKPANFGIVFNLAEQEGITITMETDGSITFTDKLKDFSEEETFTGFTVHPGIFQEWVLEGTSPEVLFMKGQVATDDLNGVARWVNNLNFSQYMKEVEKAKAEHQAKKEDPDRLEVDPSDFATEGHPAGARVFGGGVTTPAVEAEHLATDQHEEDEEEPRA